MLSVVGISYYN